MACDTSIILDLTTVLVQVKPLNAPNYGLSAWCKSRFAASRAAEDDDRGCDHGRIVADHVEPWDRRRGYAAHRRADDRRDGILNPADPHCHSGDLRRHEGRD